MVSNAPTLVSCAATLAIAIVPVWNGTISNAPTGPFQVSVRAEARRPTACEIVRGPMSRII
jgi:hypothetical protein